LREVKHLGTVGAQPGKVYAVPLDQDIRRRFIDRLLKEGPGAIPIGNEQNGPAVRQPRGRYIPVRIECQAPGRFPLSRTGIKFGDESLLLGVHSP